MSHDNAVVVFLTDLIRAKVSNDSAAAVHAVIPTRMFLHAILMKCDNAIMTNLSQMFLEPYNE